MGRPRKTPDAAIAVEPAAESKIDRVKIFERRLQSPNSLQTAPIELRDPSLICRWFNSAIGSDKVWRAKQQGWIAVRPEDLRDQDQVGGFQKSPEGYVTRGDRGQELLMSMPRVWRDKIAIAKAKENMKNMGDPKATKNEIIAAASDKLGDQAADYLDRKVGIVGNVRDQYERIERSEGALE